MENSINIEECKTVLIKALENYNNELEQPTKVRTKKRNFLSGLFNLLA